MTEQMVASAGVHLSVRSSGHLGGPTVILIHGFPDNGSTWSLVVPLLEPHFHVVTYDVRGTGGSSAPADRKDYGIDRLVDDLIAVIDRVRPDGAPIHLVGHDWGAVQAWAAVMREGSDARLSNRIASYTAIACPGLDLFGHFVKTGFRERAACRIARQLGRSWYIGFFQLPFLPELAFRRLGKRIHHTMARTQELGAAAQWSDTFPRDGANGVNLYRANRLQFTHGTTKVPVRLIVPTKDTFLSTAVYDDVALFAPDSERIDIVAGHWVIRTHPKVIAEKITGHVEAHS